MTFYQEYEQPSPDELRRRNRRWIIGIVVVVILMFVSAAIGAAAASSSRSHNRADAATTSTTRGTKATQSTKGHTNGAGTTGSTKGGSSASKPEPRATLPNGVTLPPGVTLPKTITTVTAAPPSPAVVNAYIAAFRQECQSIWSHADADGLLWDPDQPDDPPHKISECYDAIDPTDETLYDDIPDAQQYARDNVDSAVEDMTLAYRLRSTKGVVFDVP